MRSNRYAVNIATKGGGDAKGEYDCSRHQTAFDPVLYPAARQEITIYIQDDKNERFGLRVLSSDTISQVKEKIQKFIYGHGRWCPCLQLYYGGKQLEDESQLQECGIFNMSTLSLVGSLSDIQRWSDGR